jgi:hypothetical protein
MEYMRLAQTLDTPDRMKAFAKKQMTLRVAKTREKQRGLEADVDGTIRMRRGHLLVGSNDMNKMK